MTGTPKFRPTGHLRASDLRATALLATAATHAIASMAEGVHQSVWRTLGAPSGATPERARGVTGLVYQSIQGITGLVGRSLNSALIQLEPLLQRLQAPGDASPERAAVIAVLNGVMGDHLQASGNPLALPMTLSYKELPPQVLQGLEANLAPTKLLIVIHGLCMNDAQWSTEHAGKPCNHAEALAQSLHYIPV